MRASFLTFFISLFLSCSIFSQNSLQGIWEGGITVPGGQLKIIFKIDKKGSSYSGTLDIPQQGARNMKFDTVEQKGDSVSLVFSAGQITGTFNGLFDSETKISGSYSQGGPSTPFLVERTSETTENPDKPQNETDMVITNGGVEIGGTLTLPDGDIKTPLVIMSSGSGPQDRDSNVFDFKIFQIIAQHLADQGIPSFRYDDRGIGKSSGNFANATLEDLTTDVEAIISFFEQNEEHNFTRFSLLGHSQGGIVAAKAAVQNTDAVEQLVLMASPVPSLSEILRYQVKFAFANTPVDENLIEKELDARKAIMKALVENRDLEVAKSNYITAYTNLLNNLSEEQKSIIPDIDATVRNQANQLVAFYQSEQMKSLLFYETKLDLEKVNEPTLVLFGGKDTQVTVAQNKEPVIAALEKAGVGYEVKVFDSANHLFQEANTGLASEYPFLPKEFVSGFLENLSNWILSNTK